MIFYFSGTGNSLHAAKILAGGDERELVSIPEAIAAGRTTYDLAGVETLGFVFPVYAWDAPELVSDFARSLRFENYKDQHVFAVVTCGANIGHTAEAFAENLSKSGVRLNAAYDLTMPDNYIVMFKAPTKEKTQKMLAHADARLEQIAEAVRGKRNEVALEGKNPPAFVSRCLTLLFKKYCLGTKKFYATEKCTACGLCETICPVSAIRADGKRPEWTARTCAKCMACINRCPARAIEYGSGTRAKGRYVHPTAYRE